LGPTLVSKHVIIKFADSKIVNLMLGVKFNKVDFFTEYPSSLSVRLVIS